MKECYDIILLGNESLVVSEENNVDKDLQDNEMENDDQNNQNNNNVDNIQTYHVSTGSGSSGVFKNIEWQIDLPPIPETNNSPILSEKKIFMSR